MAELSHEDVSLLLAIVDGSDAARIAFEVDGLQVRIARGNADPAFLTFAMPSDSGTAAAEMKSIESEAAPKLSATCEIVHAPLLGDFIAAPSPGAPRFVEPGDMIEAGALLGMIEIVGTRHEVRAKDAGRVIQILAEDLAMVEYDQPLFVVDVAA